MFKIITVASLLISFQNSFGNCTEKGYRFSIKIDYDDWRNYKPWEIPNKDKPGYEDSVGEPLHDRRDIIPSDYDPGDDSGNRYEIDYSDHEPNQKEIIIDWGEIPEIDPSNSDPS